MTQLDFAMIGNCQISALIDTSGKLSWMCMPRFDSPAVFCSLLGDDDNGFWDCIPTVPFSTEQKYIRNTNVLTTRFLLETGDSYDVIDFAPRFGLRDLFFRPPQVIRILRSVKGNPTVRMRLRPRFGYGKVHPNISYASDGIVFSNEGNRLHMSSDIPNTYILDEQPFQLSGTRYCVLSWGESFGQSIKFGCEEFLERTIAYWRYWVKHCNVPPHYQGVVIRSALALKLHIYEDTGAIIAAPTTSIPESTSGGRNWDYRYCWLRDAYFVIHVLNQLGQFEEMESFIHYLYNITLTEDARLQPVYSISGQRELTEQILPWLKGFKGLGPVRVGNAAYAHDQYDVYGEMVLCMAPIFFDLRLDHMDLNRAFDNVSRLVRNAISVFEMPDSGIWEFRGERKHHTFSKLMSWCAVDRGLQIAKKLNRNEVISRWTEIADTMAQTIETKGWNEELGMYTQSFDSKEPDASNLLMTSLKYLNGKNPRFRRMVEEYDRRLVQNGYVFRYRNRDDFGEPQNAFTICTFWLIDALAAIGHSSEAKAMFERVLKISNHVGLLSEDVDPQTGELWGNFPQSYSHAGIINSAFRLSPFLEETY